MKDVFSSHFADDAERREKLWRDCFFVFDTNVLTSIYKRSDDARDALYKVISSLGDRLWIPYQVIHELLDNRASIAHAQAGLYTTAIANLTSVLDNFDSTTKHPFLPESLHKDFLEVSNRVIGELELKRDFHDSRLTSDDVKTALSEMLTGKVGAPYSDDQLKGIVKEGEVRYANRIPPGFEDVGKHKGSTVFSEVCKRYGDLIIWKQVIDKAKAIGKPVIFVTGEQKDDWWDRHGGKTIGPLPHLIKEFADEVGQDFFLYSHHQFLNLANTYLKLNTSSEVIDEVREAALDQETEWKIIFDKSLNHVWPRATGDESDLDDLNADVMSSAHSDLLTSELARAVAQQLVANAYHNSPNGRAPSDPREIRRRRREAERLAELENEIFEEQKRIRASRSGSEKNQGD